MAVKKVLLRLRAARRAVVNCFSAASRPGDPSLEKVGARNVDTNRYMYLFDKDKSQ